MKQIDKIIEEVFEREGISSTPNHVHKAIKEIARLTAEQALDVASEEAAIWVESDINGTEFDKAEFGGEFKEVVTVHKDSILNVKKRIK